MMTIERRGSAGLVRLHGKVDHDLVAQLDRETAGTAPLLVHWGDVSYVSSSGLAGLAKLGTTRDLRLVALPQKISQVIGLAGLDRILQIFPDEAAAGFAERNA
jgi:anti-anti-sigma factor